MFKHETNLCSKIKGACIVSRTTEQEDYPCNSILADDEEDEIWITDVGLPQDCTIQVPLHSYPVSCVGWYCKKRYVFNPKKIKLFISRSRDGPFIHWSSLRAEENTSLHLFSIQSIPADFSFFKFSVSETFGGNRVYLNKIFILRDMPSSVPENTEIRSINDCLRESPTKSPTSFSPIKSAKACTIEMPSFNPASFTTDELSKELSAKYDDLMFNISSNESGLFNFDNYNNGTVMLNYSNVSLKEISSSPLVSIPTFKKSSTARSNPLAASLPNFKKSEIEKPHLISPKKEVVTKRESQPSTKTSPLKDVSNQIQSAIITTTRAQVEEKKKSLGTATTRPASATIAKKDQQVNKENLILEERRQRAKLKDAAVHKTRKNLEELSEKVNEINRPTRTRTSLGGFKDVNTNDKKMESMEKEIEELRKKVAFLEGNIETVVKKEVEEFKTKFYEKVGTKIKNSLTKIEQRVAKENYRLMDERIRTLTHQSECKMFDYMRSQINLLKQQGDVRSVDNVKPTNNSIINDFDTSLNLSTSEQVIMLKKRMQQLH
ncbi:predicted protein [Naegleria gruberi]|uniref:Predicted protein n=1 Tax=Naegleria gruberi TaxID=5762 RepID=D2VA44_NAEGR|nr:uncharacterized protein NAEGRDRAFT_47875 [Naegleria gruberi]EFC46363.1 predicted protein [Naegleria gruberi]|eukprot:XP_002679107.1 predicted protein [Naegleria gruberi strain NEG-M]